MNPFAGKKFPMVKKAGALWVAVLMVGAGCATFHSKPLSPSRTASAFEARSLENPKLKRFLESKLGHDVNPWPPRYWDFSLFTLVSLYYHPDLDLARAQWGVARAGIITAGQRPNPSLGFTPQYDTTTASPSPWILNLILNIPIETAGRRGYRISQARHLSDAARLNIADTAWRLRSRLRAGLVDLYSAIQAEELLKEKVHFQEQIVSLMEKRVNVGEASGPDIIPDRVFLDQSRVALVQVELQKVRAWGKLADALGLPLSALKKTEISFELFEHPVPSTSLLPRKVRYQALNNRSDILALLSKYEATQSALRLEIARQYPNISLGPGFEFDQGDNKWSIGITLSLPILNRNQGPIAQAEARRKEVAAQFVALQAKAIGEIERALAGYNTLLKKLKSADTLLTEKEKLLQSKEILFSSGESDRLALLGAHIELVSGRLSRLEALVLAQQALGTLEDALQHPLLLEETFPIHSKGDPGDKEREISP